MGKGVTDPLKRGERAALARSESPDKSRGVLTGVGGPSPSKAASPKGVNVPCAVVPSSSAWTAFCIVSMGVTSAKLWSLLGNV